MKSLTRNRCGLEKIIEQKPKENRKEIATMISRVESQVSIIAMTFEVGLNALMCRYEFYHCEHAYKMCISTISILVIKNLVLSI